MIQFNLLPDVKLEFVRTQRIKRTVISASVIATGSAFLIFLILFLAVNVAQKKHMSDQNKDIKKYSTELKNTPDLDKILTIQSQLKSLPSLHSQKVAASRTFRYIQQITPTNVTLSDFTADYVENTMSITGQASGLDRVNAFVDTLKYTKYTDGKLSGQPAFSQVVLSQFTRSASATTFTITTSYDPAIFDNASAYVNLTIPNGVTTPSVVEQPTDIFQKADTNTNGSN